jgi:hypothetical protein
MSRRINIMATLPPPNSFISFVDEPSAETPVVASSPQALGAAAGCHLPEPTTSTGGCQEAPASTSTVTVAAGDAGATDCIGEIFAGARKLEQIPGIFDPVEYTAADELAYVELKLRDNPQERDLPCIPDEAAFMAEIEPLPLFLRQAV